LSGLAEINMTSTFITLFFSKMFILKDIFSIFASGLPEVSSSTPLLLISFSLFASVAERERERAEKIDVDAVKEKVGRVG
jgi:hypothetical protein